MKKTEPNSSAPPISWIVVTLLLKKRLGQAVDLHVKKKVNVNNFKKAARTMKDIANVQISLSIAPL